MSVSFLVAKALLAGAHNLRRRESLLNRINVFPVVDADTGINMWHTLSSTVDYLKKNPLDDFCALQRIREFLLSDAKGNSGVILSQFLSSFLEIFENAGDVNLLKLSRAVMNGRDRAYASVANPIEGTMLTIASKLAEALNEIEFEAKPFTIEDHSALETKLAESVIRTPKLLPRLEQAKVVDSGALGFYIFASGLMLVLPALANRESALAKMEARIKGEDEAPLFDIADTISRDFLISSFDESRFRYCVNMLIGVQAALKEGWKESFEKIGASIDFAYGAGFLKLHVHTNDRDAVIDVAKTLGTLAKVDFDDMSKGLVISLAKRGDLGREKARFRVVSDSSMSISNEVEEALGIYKLENFVSVHGRMVTGNELDKEELFARMRNGHAYTTAQASPAEAEGFVSRMLAVSERIVYMAVGEAYTGTQSAMRKAVERNESSDRIKILDTKAASGQQGLACIAAARYASRAEDFDDLVAYALHQIETCVEYLVIDDLQYLARTGRIGKIKAALAGTLSVKPIVGHGEKGAVTYVKARSHEAALGEIAKLIQKKRSQGALLIMVEYTDNENWTNRVVSKIRETLDEQVEIIKAPLSATSAVHMGPGTWGVAVTVL